MNLAAASPYIFLAVMVVGCVIAYFWYNQYKHTKNVKIAENKILCEFWKRVGKAYKVLCEEDSGEVLSGKKRKDYKEGKEPLPDGTVGIKSPEGHDIGKYFALPGWSVEILWPENAPKAQQLTIKKYIFWENIPIPALHPNPEEKIDANKLVELSAKLNKLSSDQGVAESIAARQREVVSDLQIIAQNTKGFGTLKLVIWACGGGIAICVFLLADISGKIGSLYSMYFGG